MAGVESGFVAVSCCLSGAVQSNEDSSSFKNSCPSPQRFETPESNKNSPTCASQSSGKSSKPKSSTSGGRGGFTCCVPGCFSNNKRNPELSFYNFPNGKNEESQELRKKWVNLISRKDFTPTFAHRVCSKHFVDGRKTYMNRLPLIVPKATKPTLSIPRTTTKARNRTRLSPKPTSN